MGWDLQYIIERTTGKTASVGASGLDYSLFGPCSGKKDCPTCKHIQAVMGENKDEETGAILDKDSDAIHKKALQAHKTDIPAISQEQE